MARDSGDFNVSSRCIIGTNAKYTLGIRFSSDNLHRMEVGKGKKRGKEREKG